MSISFSCTGCDRTLKVADELAGRKAKCPQCQAILYIPEGPGSAVTPVPVSARRPAAPAPALARRRAAPIAPPEDEDDRAGAEDREEEVQPRRRKKTPPQSNLMPVMLVVGAVVLVLLLAGGGFAAWWFLSPSSAKSAAAPGGGAPPAGSPGPGASLPASGDDLFYMPDGAQMVGVVRLSQLMNSGAVQQAKSQIPAVAEGIAGATASLGNINPNDIDQIVFGSQAFPTGGGDPNLVAVIHMTRSTKPSDFEALFQKGPQSISFVDAKVGGYNVRDGINGAPPGNGSSPPAYVMLDDKRFLLAPLPALHKVLQRNKKPDLSDKLQAAIQRTDMNATLAFAADVKNAFPQLAEPQPVARPGQPAQPANPFAPPPVSFDKVDGLSVTITVGTDVDVTATALCQDAASARELRDGVKKEVEWARNMLTLAALAGKALPTDVSSQLNIDPQQSGSTVTVSKTLIVAPLLKYAKEQMQAQPVPTKPPVPFRPPVGGKS
jgi:hypothetical protein